MLTSRPSVPLCTAGACGRALQRCPAVWRRRHGAAPAPPGLRLAAACRRILSCCGGAWLYLHHSAVGLATGGGLPRGLAGGTGGSGRQPNSHARCKGLASGALEPAVTWLCVRVSDTGQAQQAINGRAIAGQHLCFPHNTQSQLAKAGHALKPNRPSASHCRGRGA